MQYSANPLLKFVLLVPLFFLLASKSFGQSDTTTKRSVRPQKDMGDEVHSVFNPHTPSTRDTTGKKDTHRHYSFVPALGYTLQTGFAGLVSGNMAYFADTFNTKLSSVNTNFTYSQYNQIIVPFTADLWTKGNKYNFITDFRYISYPSSIYGLGGRTDPNKGVTINFNGIKIHQSVMKSLSDNVYVGLGYYYDQFWNIKATDQISRQLNNLITRELGNKEIASGPAFRFLYDSRANQLNPRQGSFINITYRTSEKILGSDSNWASLQIDARTYLPFPQQSNNVLAFWMLDWLTANGTPPYLLLPSTGWDDNYNTARGYIQGRFRGRDMTYFESEYRFGITRNGLVGGVAFLNLQNFSSDLSPQYSKLFAGYGVGLRLKLNKFSGANLCVDYGFGENGSHGFFVNLGEVF